MHDELAEGGEGRDGVVVMVLGSHQCGPGSILVAFECFYVTSRRPCWCPQVVLYHHANVFSCFGGKTRFLITWVKTLYVGKLYSAPRGFSPVFPSPQKLTFLNSNSIGLRAILKTTGAPVNMLASLNEVVIN